MKVPTDKSSRTTTIYSLPNEILDIILSYYSHFKQPLLQSDLTDFDSNYVIHHFEGWKDIIRFSRVCNNWKEIADYSNIWLESDLVFYAPLSYVAIMNYNEISSILSLERSIEKHHSRRSEALASHHTLFSDPYLQHLLLEKPIFAEEKAYPPVFKVKVVRYHTEGHKGDPKTDRSSSTTMLTRRTTETLSDDVHNFNEVLSNRLLANTTRRWFLDFYCRYRYHWDWYVRWKPWIDKLDKQLDYLNKSLPPYFLSLSVFCLTVATYHFHQLAQIGFNNEHLGNAFNAFYLLCSIGLTIGLLESVRIWLHISFYSSQKMVVDSNSVFSMLRLLSIHFEHYQNNIIFFLGLLIALRLTHIKLASEFNYFFDSNGLIDQISPSGWTDPGPNRIHSPTEVVPPSDSSFLSSIGHSLFSNNTVIGLHIPWCCILIPVWLSLLSSIKIVASKVIKTNIFDVRYITYFTIISYVVFAISLTITILGIYDDFSHHSSPISSIRQVGRAVDMQKGSLSFLSLLTRILTLNSNRSHTFPTNKIQGTMPANNHISFVAGYSLIPLIPIFTFLYILIFLKFLQSIRLCYTFTALYIQDCQSSTVGAAEEIHREAIFTNRMTRRITVHRNRIKTLALNIGSCLAAVVLCFSLTSLLMNAFQESAHWDVQYLGFEISSVVTILVGLNALQIFLSFSIWERFY
jgi:hypothetical protein